MTAEIVPIHDDEGRAILHDIYINADVFRWWIGSRRTHEQAMNEAESYIRKEGRETRLISL